MRTLLAALTLASLPTLAQDVPGVLPESGAIAMVGGCAIEFEGLAFEQCECRFQIAVTGGSVTTSGLNVGCRGYQSYYEHFQSRLDAEGLALLVRYARNVQDANASSMRIEAAAVALRHFASQGDVQTMTFEPQGELRFENARGKACVDAAAGALC